MLLTHCYNNLCVSALCWTYQIQGAVPRGLHGWGLCLKKRHQRETGFQAPFIWSYLKRQKWKECLSSEATRPALKSVAVFFRLTVSAADINSHFFSKRVYVTNQRSTVIKGLLCETRRHLLCKHFSHDYLQLVATEIVTQLITPRTHVRRLFFTVSVFKMYFALFWM